MVLWGGKILLSLSADDKKCMVIEGTELDVPCGFPVIEDSSQKSNEKQEL